MSHNAEVVVQYEIMNHVWVFRQIGIAHVIQTSEQLDSPRARRVLFSWHDLEIKYIVGGTMTGEWRSGITRSVAMTVRC